MPRYFFDIQDSEGTFLDDVGMDLPDMGAAIREARKTLADMLRDALRDQTSDALLIRIRDGADGPVVLSVTMTTVSEADHSPTD
jgi:hypothetical protein